MAIPEVAQVVGGDVAPVVSGELEVDDKIQRNALKNDGGGSVVRLLLKLRVDVVVVNAAVAILGHQLFPAL